ncbi:hypothetical protein M0R45_027216 [Rubus argutus]|uniref:non-specific serine/threonine protein kinase n=1 Tax=Rubus argutus TaxID=59490 RepID=A0AAW1WZV1_RUBAR
MKGFSRSANKSPEMPHRSPPPPPSVGESARNPSPSSNMSKAGGGGAPLGAFWSTQHYEDSLVVEEKTVPKFDESTNHSTSKHDRTHLDNHPFPKNSVPAKVENTPTYAARRNSHVKSQKCEDGFPKDIEVSFFQKDTDHGAEGPKVYKPESTTSFQDDSFNSFVAEFDTNKLSLGASNSKSGKEEALETEVERLNEQLKQANLEKAEITSKFEKLSAICRSQRQELQELKQTLAARTPSPNKGALRNQTSPGVQTSATHRRINVTRKLRVQRRSHGGQSFSAAPTGSTQISRPMGEGNISQRYGDARAMESKPASQPAGWAGF